jgi:hypothetical protein
MSQERVLNSASRGCTRKVSQSVGQPAVVCACLAAKYGKAKLQERSAGDAAAEEIEEKAQRPEDAAADGEARDCVAKLAEQVLDFMRDAKVKPKEVTSKEA